MSAPEVPDGRRKGRSSRVTITEDGPVIIEGPVDIEMADGTVVHSDRRFVALCTCRRSKTAPFCDTSHRARKRAPTEETRR